MKRQRIATIEMDGARLRGQFPEGHAWTVQVVGSLEEGALHSLAFEVACRCGWHRDEVWGPAFAQALLVDARGFHAMLDGLLADLFDEHFSVRQVA